MNPAIKKYLESYPEANAFHKKMVKCRDEYQEYLLLQKSDGTGATHPDIIHAFVNFLFSELVTSFDQITVAMVNSKFQTYYKKFGENIPKEEMKKILKGFFVFVYGKYAIKNEKVMRGLER